MTEPLKAHDHPALNRPDLPRLRFWHPLDWLRAVGWYYFSDWKASAYSVQHGSATLRRTGSSLVTILLLLALLIPLTAYALDLLPGSPPTFSGQPLTWGIVLLLVIIAAPLIAALGSIGDQRDLGIILALFALIGGGFIITLILTAPPRTVLGTDGKAAFQLAAALSLLLFLYPLTELANELAGIVPIGAVVGAALVCGWELAISFTQAISTGFPPWLLALTITIGTVALIVALMIGLNRLERRLQKRSFAAYGLIKLTLGLIGAILLAVLFWFGGWMLFALP